MITPDPEDGPVLVTVEYRVHAERAGNFIEAIDAKLPPQGPPLTSSPPELTMAEHWQSLLTLSYRKY